MARLTALPAIEVIRGLKGIIDFYLWKGLPCARAWPTWRPARQSDASKAAALFFGAVVKSYSLLGDLPLAAYRQDAADQPRSARDVFVSGIYGNLHEADVSDFLALLIECRDFLSALTAILGALDSIDTDELVVNVDESVLPPGAATAAKQLPDGHNVTVDNPSLPVTGTFWQPTQPVRAATLPLPAGAASAAKQLPDGHNVTLDNPFIKVSADALPLPAGAATSAAQASQLTALQKLDDLQDALQSKHLDRFLVRGMDQLFSFLEPYKKFDHTFAAANGTNEFYSHTVPAGQFWKFTSVNAQNMDNDPVEIELAIWDDVDWVAFRREPTPGVGVQVAWNGELWLKEGDRIAASIRGCLAGDEVYAQFHASKMTKET